MPFWITVPQISSGLFWQTGGKSAIFRLLRGCSFRTGEEKNEGYASPVGSEEEEEEMKNNRGREDNVIWKVVFKPSVYQNILPLVPPGPRGLLRARLSSGPLSHLVSQQWTAGGRRTKRRRRGGGVS